MNPITNSIVRDGETLRRCPRCEETLRLSEFGLCRARPDGLNLYCKPCIRQKKAQTAAGLPPRQPKLDLRSRMIARILRKLEPCDRVLKAIELGAYTQEAIASTTKLSIDEVCDSLADLLLWTRRIRTAEVDDRRMYFVCESEPVIPARKENVRSFSSVAALMPGRRAEVRGQRPEVRRKAAA